jgi:hypothetical protein
MANFRIKKLEEQKNPKDVFPNALGIINYAFSITENGIDHDYYQWANFNEVPNERGFSALSYYNELNQRCSREYLLAFSAALDSIVNNPKAIKITDVVVLNLQLKERLEMLFEPEIAYKLCTVVFFDETENPHRYDYEHGRKKAKLFKEAPLNEFFFSVPITTLIPYINTWAKDFPEYCQLVTEMTENHIKSISTMLSASHKTQDWFKELALQNILDSVSEK